jgi:hypothetical protein
MDTQKLEALPPPPGVIASLQAGFNIVSSRIALITLPLALNVFLWLGPRMSIGTWYGALYANWITLLKQSGIPSQNLALYTENGPLILNFVNRLNWLGWIRTLPVGVPVLMLSLPDSLPGRTPLGVQSLIQLPSFWIILGVFLLLTFLGWLAGGLYFRLVAGASLGDASREAGIGLGRAWIQTILLSVIWEIGLTALFIPIMMLVGFLGIVNVVLAQVVFFILLFFLLWLVVPLFFTPHGIFMRKQNALISILSSLRMSRFTLPTSSFFVLSVFLLARGLGYLWNAPSNDSWLMLVGIAGHAFISTTLLAASFVYYREVNKWLEYVSERLQQISNHSSIRKI